MTSAPRDSAGRSDENNRPGSSTSASVSHSPDTSPEADLDRARALASIGVPVFCAYPDPEGKTQSGRQTGFALPTGWPNTTASAGYVDAWQPGMALCAVMGRVFDLVDTDPRGGFDPATSELPGIMPTVYGVQATPSGGWHGFVATFGVRSRDGVLPGVDIKAGIDGQGHGFAFLAPTVRPSKVTGELLPYRWERFPDLEALKAIADDRSGEKLAELVRKAHGANAAGSAPGLGILDSSPLDDIRGTLHKHGRDTGTYKLASALRGRGGWRVDDALAHMRVVVWPEVEKIEKDHPFTIEDFEAKIRRAFEVYPDGNPGMVGGAQPTPHAGSGVDTATPPETRGETWRPLDLSAVLAGEHVAVEPTVGIARRDGLRLLYAGKEHAAIGEMESGKSWLAVACAVAELTVGNCVVYVHFEEADPTDIVGRLRELGMANDVIAERFHYVAPNERVDAASLGVLVELGARLVVLDGVNEAMSLHGWKIMEPTGATEYRHRLVKPFTTTGAAVLSLDHVTKDPERRGRNALGSIHKGNGLTGSLIVLENVAPFGRDARGCSHVFIAKDRPGWLRRHGKRGKLPGKTYIGSLVVDDTNEHRSYLDLAFIEPQDNDETAEPSDRNDQDDQHVFDVVAEINTSDPPATVRKARASAAIGKDRLDGALTRLVMSKRLNEQPGPRNSRQFTVADNRGRDDRSGGPSE